MLPKARPKAGPWTIRKTHPVILDLKKKADPFITTISKPQHNQVEMKPRNVVKSAEQNVRAD